MSFKVVGRGKGGFSDFSEEQRLFSSKVYFMVREIDVPWDPVCAAHWGKVNEGPASLERRELEKRRNLCGGGRRER